MSQEMLFTLALGADEKLAILSRPGELGAAGDMPELASFVVGVAGIVASFTDRGTGRFRAPWM